MYYKMIPVLVLWGLVWSLGGCGGEDTQSSSTTTTTEALPECPAGTYLSETGECVPAGLPPDMQCPPGEMPLEGGGCQAAGLPADMPCPPGEMPWEGGGCQAAGIPPEQCGEGFVPDGKSGCIAVLPKDPCPAGQMAVPGETECHEVAPCGDGPWGDIPVEATTQFVDGSYSGDSDGTKQNPWKTIKDGVEHAAPGAIVAVAAGTYNEMVLIQDKPVRLWGKCPSEVEVVAVAGGRDTTISVLESAASGSEIRSLAITGAGHGMLVSGALDVRIDRVWAHDTAHGIGVEDFYGPTRVMVNASLIESAQEAGVLVSGSEATLDATVVRATQPNGNNSFGWGIGIQANATTGERAKVDLQNSVLADNHQAGVLVLGSDATIRATVVRTTHTNGYGKSGVGIGIVGYAATGEGAKVDIFSSVVEQNQEIGVLVAGSDATIDATAVRATQQSGDGKSERGISIEYGDVTAQRSNVELRRSMVEGNHESGVFVGGSDARMEAILVQATQPDDEGRFGWGINIQDHAPTGERANVELVGSVVQENHELGVLVAGSDATIDATVVRATQMNGDEALGWGLAVWGADAPNERARLELRRSVVEENHYVGVFVSGSDATIESTVVRATQPTSDGTLGRGLNFEYDDGAGERARAVLRGLVVEDNHEVGVFVSASDATIESTVVRATQPSSDGTLGRGVNIQDHAATRERANVELRDSVVEGNRDAGVFVSGSDATIESTLVRMTQPDGNGEFGRGIQIQNSTDTDQLSQVVLQTSIIDDNREAGVAMVDSGATITGTIVRATQPNDHGLLGDGVTVVASGSGSASMEITGARIEFNERAGILFFSAEIKLYSSIIACNKFDLNGEETAGQPFTKDTVGNLCGCEDLVASCPVESADLTWPSRAEEL